MRNAIQTCAGTEVEYFKCHALVTAFWDDFSSQGRDNLIQLKFQNGFLRFIENIQFETYELM